MFRPIAFLSVLLCLSASAQTPAPPPHTPAILQAADAEKIFPATVYFSGQVASVQLRNSGGVRSSNAKLTLFAMVDSSGYASGLRERYQFYLLTDTAIEISGNKLQPGAYGGGFLAQAGFLVMDLGGTELFHTPLQHDASMRRPRPLQVLPGSAGGQYRICAGRDCVTFRQVEP